MVDWLTLTIGCDNIAGMKFFKFLSLLTCAMLPSVASAYVQRDSAVLRVMNKDAGKVQEVVVAVGSEIQFEKLFINVRDCKQTDPFDAENYFAFVEIFENNKGQIFGGWLNRNEPGQNPLQHPDYDVWLVKCE
ncbi:MAG: DUF2155 domain-containing protein [Alphaproteobacteria bacterium]|nr:DUF2155 domain-containing protein [Alphaproteobacteria bacterium]